MSSKPWLPFDQAIADTICTGLADGKSLREICEPEAMPSRATVYKWLELHASFADQYARARTIQQHAYADDIIWIGDTEKDPNVARVKIDARKWHAGKLLPKVYGDHLDINAHVKHELPTAAELAAAAKRLDEEL